MISINYTNIIINVNLFYLDEIEWPTVFLNELKTRPKESLSLWKDADPCLPDVDDARERLAGLKI